MRAAPLRTRTDPYPPPTDPIPTGPSRAPPAGPGRTPRGVTDRQNRCDSDNTLGHGRIDRRHVCATPPHSRRRDANCRRSRTPFHPSRDSPPAGPSPFNDAPAGSPSTPAPRPQPYSKPGRARRCSHRNPVRHAHHRRTAVYEAGTGIAAHVGQRPCDACSCHSTSSSSNIPRTPRRWRFGPSPSTRSSLRAADVFPLAPERSCTPSSNSVVACTTHRRPVQPSQRQTLD